MNSVRLRLGCFSSAIFLLAATGGSALGQKKYDTGATDTEIKIGNIMPYSGPASAYGVIGKTEAAYFRMINDNGGINGRKITLLSYDDGYSPPKTFEQVRKLVESDEVPARLQSSVRPPIPVQNYLNEQKVPQLFAATGATKWNDPEHFPWTMALSTQLPERGRASTREYILKDKPDARIGVLYQNDDLGKDYLKGVEDGLGAKASMIEPRTSYETIRPDHRVFRSSSCKAPGGYPRHHHDPEIRVAGDQEDRRDRLEAAAHLACISTSIGGTDLPAGLENAQGDPVGSPYPRMVLIRQWNEIPTRRSARLPRQILSGR